MRFEHAPVWSGQPLAGRVRVPLLLCAALWATPGQAYSTYVNFKLSDSANPPSQSVTVDSSGFSAPGHMSFPDPLAAEDADNQVRLHSGLTGTTLSFNPTVEAMAHAPLPELNGEYTTYQSTGQLEYATKVTALAGADATAAVPVLIYIAHYSIVSDIAHASTLGYVDILNTANIGHDVQLFYFCNAGDRSGCTGNEGSETIVSLMVTPGYSLLTSIEAVAYANGGHTASSVGGIFDSTSDAMMDPYFEIDPAWAASHPGYDLSVEAGFGNTLPVPEPSAFSMGLAGALGLAGARRWRSRSAGQGRGRYGELSLEMA